LVQVSGLALVGLGVWLHVNRDSLFYTQLVRASPPPRLTPTPTPTPPYSSPTTSSPVTSSLLSTDVISVDSWPFFMMAAGCCVTLVGFLGCCGACTESVCFLSFVRTSATCLLTYTLNEEQ